MSRIFRLNLSRTWCGSSYVAVRKSTRSRTFVATRLSSYGWLTWVKGKIEYCDPSCSRVRRGPVTRILVLYLTSSLWTAWPAAEGSVHRRQTRWAFERVGKKLRFVLVFRKLVLDWTSDILAAHLGLGNFVWPWERTKRLTCTCPATPGIWFCLYTLFCYVYLLSIRVTECNLSQGSAGKCVAKPWY
jgi:hypothetical protein